VRDPRVSAKGDLVVGIGNNEVDIVPIGLSGRVLTADPTVVTGMSWQPAAGGASGLSGFGRTDATVGTFGPCGDSGTWTACPAAFRPVTPAAAGNKLLWGFEHLHQTDQEAVYDLASMDGETPLRYLSSGTATPSAAGYGGLYTAATLARGLRPTWWDVDAADIIGGNVTIALWYRNNGSGNTMGHASVAGRVVLANFGGTPA
jgi:hypothetical protein